MGGAEGSARPAAPFVASHPHPHPFLAIPVRWARIVGGRCRRQAPRWLRMHPNTILAIPVRWARSMGGRRRRQRASLPCPCDGRGVWHTRTGRLRESPLGGSLYIDCAGHPHLIRWSYKQQRNKFSGLRAKLEAWSDEKRPDSSHTANPILPLYFGSFDGYHPYRVDTVSACSPIPPCPLQSLNHSLSHSSNQSIVQT